MQQQVVESSAPHQEQEQALTRTLLKIIAELAPQPTADPDRGARLVEDLGYHSLALLELAFALEDEFHLKPIDESAARAIQTVGDVVDYVLNELRATRSG